MGENRASQATQALVVYYSISGNTRKAAEAIAKALHAELEAIVPESQPRSGFMLYVRVGLSLVLDRWDVRPSPHDLARFRLLVIGGPIWVGRFAAPVRSWLRVHALAQHTRLGLFCTMGSGVPATAFTQIEALAGRPAIARLALAESELTEPRFSAQISAFAGQLMHR